MKCVKTEAYLFRRRAGTEHKAKDAGRLQNGHVLREYCAELKAENMAN